MTRMDDTPAPSPPLASTSRLRVSLRPRDLWFVAVATVIVAADQVVKWVIRDNVIPGDSHSVVGDLLRIVHFTNDGAAFGLFQGAGPLLAITSIIGLGAIVVFLLNPAFAQPLTRLALALMLGGAIGNLIDRVRVGEVVDFIKVPNFPAFNVADSAISVGVTILIWTMLFMKPPSNDAKSP